MRIATLSIGDELILGQVTDTNASFIAAALLEHGLRVRRHVTVGDSEPDIAAALDSLSQGNDVLIVTGGLGPTEDDMTARAAAQATGRLLVVNQEAQAHIRTILDSLNLLYSSPPDDKQARIPESAVLIPNPTGTACGFRLTHSGCLVFFLPGVPSEMSCMLHESVIPFIIGQTDRAGIIRSGRFNLFGPAEAEVDERLRGIGRPDQGLYLGICVTFPWMRVSLRAEARSDEAANSLLEPAVREVRERLKEWLFSEGEETMDEAVAALFRKSGITLALAESCTGGMIAQRITAIPGSSAYFMEGLVTYSNAAKERLLGVPAQLLDEHGAVSAECAAAMAGGVRTASGSDLGLAVTGIAGPDGGTAEKPVGTVFISLADSNGCRTERFRFYGSRDQIRVLTAWTALEWLRRYLFMKK
jgi:nicotinamide-nucleotide amidase